MLLSFPVEGEWDWLEGNIRK